MKLNNSDLYGLLLEKNVTHLYHANTTSTSMTYLTHGGLLSRGGVESKGLYQSPQSSDEIDKKFNIWNDVFLDTEDLHRYFNRQNFYGPICFKIKTDFLLKESFEIWVTKDNPICWTEGMSDADKYFVSVEELREKWDLYQRQKKMITICNQLEPILFDYIEVIIIDIPGVNLVRKENDVIVESTNLLVELVKGLKTVVGDNHILKNKFLKRECQGCFCHTNYLNDISIIDLKRLFLPSDHTKYVN